MLKHAEESKYNVQNIIFVSIQQQKDKPPAKSKRIKVLTMEEDITDKGSVNSEDHLLQKANVSKDHFLQEAGRENREGKIKDVLNLFTIG